MAAILNELKAIWARLDGGQRLVVSSVLFASLVGLGAMVWYSSQPDYVEIDVSNEKMGEARDALTRAGIGVVGEGRTLKIDRDDLGQATFILNVEGINSSPEMAIPDLLGGVTLDRDSRQAMLAEQNRLRAEMAIRGLQDVLEANVTAFKPKTSPWKANDAQNMPAATASIRLRPGATLYQVAPLVASQVTSATGVAREYVTVIDTVTRQSWTYDPKTGNGADMNQFLQMQRDISDEKTRDAQELLDQAYPGLARVRVTVELDNVWENGQDRLTSPDPVLKSDLQQDSRTENGIRPAGDPSVAASSGQTASPGGTTSSSKETRRDKVFEPFVGERNWGQIAPSIKRVTSTVIIDRSLESAVADILAGLEPVIGRDPDRDPPTKYLVTDFATAEPLELEAMTPGLVAVVQGPGFTDMLREWGPTIGQILGVLLVLLFLRGLLKRDAPVAAKAAAAGQAQAVSADDAEKQIRGEIERAIAEDPAAISRLLESWLTEQKA